MRLFSLFFVFLHSQKGIFIMTHQPNKQFNTYKEGLDLEFLREYCMEHGERRTFLRGERLRVGELARE